MQKGMDCEKVRFDPFDFRCASVQKFIVGSPADGMAPVPLVLGMSATPQWFNTLLGSIHRHTFTPTMPVDIQLRDNNVVNLARWRRTRLLCCWPQ
jgi:hypothetical protein